MINLEFVLNDGVKLNAKTETFDLMAYQEKLNNHQTLIIALGDVTISKGLIQHVLVVDEESDNIKIDFHNGTSVGVAYPEYNAVEVENQVNNTQSNFVVIGNVIANRNAIKMTTKIQ